MAFRHPTYHAPQRVYTAGHESPVQQQQPSPPQSHTLRESQEWILFSPGAGSTTEGTYTTSTDRTQTAGRSRISDLGSLESAARARSYGYEASEQTDAAVEDEEDGELDSLDSHLHEFRSEPSVYQQDPDEAIESSQPVLPTHDGLGSFRINATGMGEDVQEHLYAFERYNPRRTKRRRESLDLAQVELELEQAAEVERTRRIEEWRMEQSRFLVDEIQRETRRRRQSLSTDRRSTLAEREQEELATLSSVRAESAPEEAPGEEYETIWNKITKRVIHDLLGIDDDLLSIIFGGTSQEELLSTTPPANRHDDANPLSVSTYNSSSWEHRLFDRIARELGILVHQLTDHPGAFTAYLRSQQAPLPYAGLPIIPESGRDAPITTEPASKDSASSTPAPVFHPTIPPTTAPVNVPLPSSTSLSRPALSPEDATPRASSQPLSRAEWERDLDMPMVFRYLRTRLTSKFSSAPASTAPLAFQTAGTSHLATASTAETAARAARVRQHHPLVTRQHSNIEKRRSLERRTWKASVPASVAVSVTGSAHGPVLLRRGSSSCASERSGVRGKGVVRSGSSRHYWDFGGSSSSVVGSTGGMGSWGEV